jgi:hypothetical protein
MVAGLASDWGRLMPTGSSIKAPGMKSCPGMIRDQYQ